MGARHLPVVSAASTDVRTEIPSDLRECMAVPALCFAVTCPHNISSVMTARGTSSTRCMLHHGPMSPKEIGRVLGIHPKEVAKIVNRAKAKLRHNAILMGLECP